MLILWRVELIFFSKIYLKIYFFGFFSYRIKDSVCALCLCDQNFPRKLAFSFLEDVATEFLNQNGNRVSFLVNIRFYAYHF